MAVLIQYHQQDCTGCRICEIVCSMEHLKKINVSQAMIRYDDNWPRVGKVKFCRQCPQKSCLQACPSEAISLSPEGSIQLDRERCTACLLCSSACPYGELPTDGHYPLFCDKCGGRFQCVAWCPRKALIKAGEENV